MIFVIAAIFSNICGMGGTDTLRPELGPSGDMSHGKHSVFLKKQSNL
ncbi:hypothetical protein EYZ11_006222 [Aspergillus tanneri]|uniref:Uncharacterized protein n=1 Tax=Aspergillus tanneri TaxID=1220188 RepID=A0A4S3JFY9_9EURO|nr:hypothetical protein EYZ11_006222 [Aspergillus tanneri]